MQKFKDRVSEIVRKYEEPLAAKGIRIAISKRNAETEVQERSDGYAYTGQVVMNTVDRAIDRKKERDKGYNNQRNRYHSIVITALPIDKKLVPRDRCREYAFVLRKVERAHLGEEPQKKMVDCQASATPKDSKKTSAGVFQPRHLRGLLFISRTTLCKSSLVSS